MSAFTRRTVIAGAAVAGIAALALAGCSSTTSPTTGPSSAASYKIAFEGPITGDSASDGAYQRAGIELALADYKAKYPSGPTVTVAYEDSQGDPTVATPIATKVAADATILGLVGPSYSGESKATAPAYTEAGLVTVSPSATNDTLTSNGWTSFHRIVAADQYQAQAAVNLLTKTDASTQVFVIDDSSDYGKGLGGNIVKDLGSSLVGQDEIDGSATGSTDYSTTVTKVKSSGATSVYFAGYGKQAGLLVKQLKDGGYTGVFATGDGSYAKELIDNGGSAAEGVQLTFPGGAPSADFATKWNALTDAEGGDKGQLGAYSEEAYDAATILLTGIGEGKTTRADLLAFVNSYDADGLTKHIKFAANGDLDSADLVYQELTVTSGAFTTVGPISLN